MPDSTWSHAFDEAYNSVKGNMWRSAKVVGREIIISCHHSQLKEIYVPQIQSAIENANITSKKISEAYAKDMARRKEEQSKKQDEKQEMLDDINSQFK